MTSKSSLFNLGLIREALRRNLWAVALTLLGLFCSIVLPVVMVLQNAAQKVAQSMDAVEVHANTLEMLQRFLGVDNIPAKLVMTVLAVALGVAMYAYLHSRQQIDFYHSLPVRRSTLFTINYVTGVVIVFPIYLVMTALAVAITAFGGYGAALDGVSLGIATDLVFFLINYTCTILCMILCGNRIISMLLLLWAQFSAPLALGLFTGLCDAFYHTFSQPSPLTNILMARLSPMLQYFSIMEGTRAHGYTIFFDNAQTTASLPLLLFGYLLATAALVALSYVLFARRKSERAGCAIAFQGLKLPLKFWCVTIMAIGVGILLHAICDANRFVWMYFGFAFGGILTHFLMEIIYAFDFKAIFSHIKALVIYGVIFIVFITGMRLDVLSFDSYLPDASDVHGVQITAYSPTFDMSDNWDDRSLTDQSNIDSVLKLASYGLSHDIGDEYQTADDIALMNMTVTYFKNSGLQTSRSYTFPYKDGDKIGTLLDKVTFSQEYISKCMPVYTFELTGNDLLSVHTEKSMDDSAVFTKDQEVISKVISALRRESLSITPDLAESESPVMCLELNTFDPSDLPAIKSPKEISSYNFTASSDYIPVYASYTETLALLKQTLGVVPEKPNASDVESIILTIYPQTKDADSAIMHTTPSYENTAYAVSTKDYTRYATAKVTSPEDITALLKNASSSMMYSGSFQRLQTESVVTIGGKKYDFDVQLCMRSGSSSGLVYSANNVPTEVLQKYFS